jgi:hypothetical protein
MRNQSSATSTESIPLPSGDRLSRHPRRIVIRRVTSRLFGGARHVWRETTEAHERIFSRPWEQEGPLRWQRDVGGPKLLGTAIALNENEPDTLRPPH